MRHLQAVAAAEEGIDITKADNVVRTIQRKIQALDVLIGPDRRAHVLCRLSNAGSSNAGAVYSNRVDAYKKKVCHPEYGVPASENKNNTFFI